VSDQWAKVPLSLVTSVPPSAVVLYVTIAAHAHREHRTATLSNDTLVARTGLSLSSVHRAKRQLVAGGWIEHDGVQGREHVPTYTVHIKGVTRDTVSTDKGCHQRHNKGVTSGTQNRSRTTTEVVTATAHSADEEESPMGPADEPMFEVEAVEFEPPIGQLCLGAFLDAYGQAPISRSMIARMGKRFKELGDTYSRDELVACAAELGAKRIATPNAVEPFILRARQPARQQAAGWSALALDTLRQMPDPYAQQG
jgi:hypothetical protein